MSLTRNGGGNLLTGSQSLTSADNITWTLGGLSGLTAASGAYTLTLTAAASGIVDGVGNPLAANASDTWTTDAQPPTVDIVDVAPDPRNSAVGQLTIVFSEPISGLDLGDLSLTRNGGGNLLTGSQSLTSANNVTWTLGGLSGLTAWSGIHADADRRRLGHCRRRRQSAGGECVGHVDHRRAPTVNIGARPGNSAVGQLTIVFSEPISGLDLGDWSLTLNGGGNLLTGSQSLTSASNVTWTLDGLSR